VSEGNGSTAEKHAPNGAGNGGVVPPIEHRWKPGISPNPGGLPRGTKQVKKRLRNELMRYLRDNPGKKRDIVLGLIAGCEAGDAACQRIAWDRVDGVLEKKIDIRARAIVKVLVRGDDP
jgi:hypothetical protein